jgi:hypothetical protein
VHLESLARQDDQSAVDLLTGGPALPARVTYLWNYFQDLSQTRTSNGMGPSRLTRLEIRAWEEDEHIELEPWERRTIMALDRLWIRFQLDPEYDPESENQPEGDDV